MQIIALRKGEFFDSSLHHIFESEKALRTGIRYKDHY